MDWIEGTPTCHPQSGVKQPPLLFGVFFDPGQQLETFLLTRSLWCYITKHFTINYMNGHKILFSLHCINWHESEKTRHFTIKYIDGQQKYCFYCTVLTDTNREIDRTCVTTIFCLPSCLHNYLHNYLTFFAYWLLHHYLHNYLTFFPTNCYTTTYTTT